MPDSESLAFWRSVGEEFRDNPSVMFDAFNEPYSRYNDRQQRWVFELSWKCWRDGGCAAPVADDRTATVGQPTYVVQGMESLVQTIRDTGAAAAACCWVVWTTPTTSPSGWSSAPTTTSSWRRSTATTSRVQRPRRAGRPCWAGWPTRCRSLTTELGATDPTAGYVDTYLDWLDERGLGVVFWVWANHPTDPMSLLRDQGGKPTDYGRLARSWLTG